MSVPGNPTPQPSPPRFLRLDTREGKIDVGTNGRTFGRNAAENVISVAAVRVPSTGVFSSSSLVEPGSADGPRRIFYKPENTLIKPQLPPLAAGDGGQLLLKPDLAAANRVKTTLPAGTLNPFEGTSAAAPHVAGLAALILSYRPNLTPAQVREILIASALRIEDQSKPWNEVSGYGIPMADDSLKLAGSLQFGPKLAIKELGNTLATFRLNEDRSVSDWPVSVKANAIENGTVLSTDGSVTQVYSSGQMDTIRPRGSDVIRMASDIGFLFKGNGAAEVEAQVYNGFGIPIPDPKPLQDVVAGAGDMSKNAYFFLKRNGTVELWALSETDRQRPQPVNNFHLVGALQTGNVVDLRSMIGSLPLAMLRRDGTVVTVDRNGTPRDTMTYGGRTMTARPSGVRDIVAIATGYAHVLALGRDGKVTAWGANHVHQSDVPSTLTDVVSIAAAGNMSYALTRGGQTVSWGGTN